MLEREVPVRSGCGPKLGPKPGSRSLIVERRRLSDLGKGLVDVLEDVVDVLDAD
jgi:hypothetical protein